MWNLLKAWIASLQTSLAKLGTWWRQEGPKAPFIVESLDPSPKDLLLGLDKPVQIRFGSPQDAPAIAQVEAQAYGGNPPWSLSAFQEDLAKNKQALYLVAYKGEDLIGFLGSRFNPGYDVHITNLTVLPDYRFLGLAQALIQRLEKYARAKDKTALTLEVRASNGRAIRLYQKVGFVTKGIKKSYYQPEGEDGLDMEYLLPVKRPASLDSADYSFRRLSLDQTLNGRILHDPQEDKQDLDPEEDLPQEVGDSGPDQESHQVVSNLAHSLYQLAQDNYEASPNWTPLMFDQDLSDPSTTYYGVYAQDQLIGFAGFKVVLDEADLTNIVLEKDYQGLGLAQRLWKLALYDLQEKGVGTIFLEVRESNARAQSLYQILGLEAYHKREAYYDHPKEDAILYRYLITPKEEAHA